MPLQRQKRSAFIIRRRAGDGKCKIGVKGGGAVAKQVCVWYTVSYTLIFTDERFCMLNRYLYVFLVSMVPLIELRGAIPIGVGLGLPLWQVYVISIIGNMIPVPIIFFFARRVLEWGADKPVIGKFFRFFLEKGHKGGEKLKQKAGRGLFWALLLFVGIPVPGTGAWTGTLAASLLDMDFKSSVLACMGGVLLAGCIMGAVSLLGFSAIGAIL